MTEIDPIMSATSLPPPDASSNPWGGAMSVSASPSFTSLRRQGPIHPHTCPPSTILRPVQPHHTGLNTLSRVSKHADRRQISTLVDLRGPVFLLRDADAAGISRAVIRRLFADGELQRLAKSAFARSETMDRASIWERFRLRSIAFVAGAQDGTFLTGAAAAAVCGLPMVSDPPTLPTAIRHGSPHTGHRLTPYGSVRHGYLPPRYRSIKVGVPVVSRAYCAVDIARHFGSRDGLVVADRVLHTGTSRDEVASVTTEMDLYPGIREARWVAEHADQRAESPLETLGRFAFLSAALPPPLSNVWIPAGHRWFRVDHLLPETGVVIEADGAIKYDNRADAAQRVADDRERERLLRGAGFAVIRYHWSTAVHHPRQIIHRADEAARLRGTAPVPTCWTLESPFS